MYVWNVKASHLSTYFCSYILMTLDIESRYLVEDILEEMDKEDEGGVV